MTTKSGGRRGGVAQIKRGNAGVTLCLHMDLLDEDYNDWTDGPATRELAAARTFYVDPTLARTMIRLLSAGAQGLRDEDSRALSLFMTVAPHIRRILAPAIEGLVR